MRISPADGRASCVLPDENGFRTRFFETQVYRPPDGTRTVDCPRRNRHAIPWQEPQFTTVFQIDGEASFHDDEQLIR